MLTAPSTRTRRTHRGRSRRGFTLVEATVVIAVVAVIALLAVPTMRPVLDRTHERTASLQLEQFHRLGLTSATTQRRAGVVVADFNDPTPRSLTVAGDGNRHDPSPTYGEVSVGIFGDGRDISLAMRAKSDRCIGLFATGATVVELGPLELAGDEPCTAVHAVPDSYDRDVYTPPARATEAVAPTLTARQALVNGDPAASLTWTTAGAPGGLTGYRIMRDGSERGEVDRTSNEYVDTDVDDASSYQYRVIPLGGDGEGEPSNVVTLQLARAYPPVVSVDGSAAEPPAITVGWSPGVVAGGTVAYEVRRNGVTLTDPPLPASNLSFVDTDVIAGLPYTYEVHALNAGGEKMGSEPVTAVAEGGVATGAGTLAAWGVSSEVSASPAGQQIATVGGGTFHHTAVTADGELVSWGRDNDGQVSNTPTGSNFIDAAAGYRHSSALTAAGTLVTWGHPSHFDLVETTPTGSGFVQVDSAYDTNAALHADGTVHVWGRNTHGAVSGTPGDAHFIDVAMGTHHVVGLTRDGRVQVWGADNFGQVRDAPTGAGFVSVSAHSNVSAAVNDRGELTVWGTQNSALVDDAPTGGGFVDVAVGVDHAVALRATGEVVAWGTSNAGVSSPDGDGFHAVFSGRGTGFALSTS